MKDWVKERIKQLGPWFHDLNINGFSTKEVTGVKGDLDAIKEARLFSLLESNLRGKRVLDIGCNAGRFLFMCESRGAKVVGVEPWTNPYYRQLEFAKVVKKSVATTINNKFENLEDDEIGFDIILALGVVYHSENPILFLRKIRKNLKDGGYAVIEMCGSPSDVAFMDVENALFTFSSEKFRTLLSYCGFVIKGEYGVTDKRVFFKVTKV